MAYRKRAGKRGVKYSTKRRYVKRIPKYGVSRGGIRL